MRPTLSILFFIPTLFGVVASVPFKLQYDKTTDLKPGQQANTDRLKAAESDANRQIQKMQEGITKYRSGTPEEQAKVRPLYEAAFGTNSDSAKVAEVIGKLHSDDSVVPVKVDTHYFGTGDDRIASIPWTGSGDTWAPGDARFSSRFHGTSKDKDQRLDAGGRTATLIHEATHRLAETGDYVAQNGKEIVKAKSTTKVSQKTGYTSDPNGHRTLAAVQADSHFSDVKKAVSNMHDNAESYAVFASLCSQPGALRRRDAALYRRALAAGDSSQLIHLARRNKCKLPKDYFAKKATTQKQPGSKGSQAITKAGTTKPANLGAKTKTMPIKGGTRLTNPKSSLKKSGNHRQSAAQRVKTQHTLSPKKGAPRTTGHGVGKSTNGKAKGKVGPPRPGRHITHSTAKLPSRPSIKKNPSGKPASKKPLSAGRPGRPITRPAAKPASHRIARPPGRSTTRPSAKRPVARPAPNRIAKNPAAQRIPQTTSRKHSSKPISHSGTKHSASKKPLSRPATRPAPNRQTPKQPIARPVAHAARPASHQAVKSTAHPSANRGKVAALKSVTKTTPKSPPKRQTPRPAVKGRKH